MFDGEFILREPPFYDNGIREYGRYQRAVTYSFGIMVGHKDISTCPWDPSFLNELYGEYKDERLPRNRT